MQATKIFRAKYGGWPYQEAVFLQFAALLIKQLVQELTAVHQLFGIVRRPVTVRNKFVEQFICQYFQLFGFLRSPYQIIFALSSRQILFMDQDLQIPGQFGQGRPNVMGERGDQLLALFPHSLLIFQQSKQRQPHGLNLIPKLRDFIPAADLNTSAPA